MQESRLFKIVYYLLDKGKATAPQLAERFEVSVRTIYRDIDAISSAGIPIYSIQGNGGGISILDTFILEKTLLSTEEKEQILMAVQSIIATEQSVSGDLLFKLGSLFQMKNTSWIEVDFSDWIRNTNQNNFNLFKNAIMNKNMVNIQYFSQNRERTWRRVAPIKLVYKSKAWYLYGFCFMRNDYRFFKLNRITDVELLSDNYSNEIMIPPVTVKEIKKVNTIPVVLKFDKEIAFRVYDEFTENIETDEEGYLYVKIDLPHNEILYSYILSFEHYVEVIDPLEIRENMKTKLNILLKKYET